MFGKVKIILWTLGFWEQTLKLLNCLWLKVKASNNNIHLDFLNDIEGAENIAKYSKTKRKTRARCSSFNFNLFPPKFKDVHILFLFKFNLIILVAITNWIHNEIHRSNYHWVLLWYNICPIFHALAAYFSPAIVFILWQFLKFQWHLLE